MEARYIRKEEVKQRNYGRFLLRTQKAGSELPYATYLRLREHRMEIRSHSRATGLARAYMKGQPYAEVETPKHGRFIDVPSIVRMVNKYQADPDGVISAKTIRAWMDI